VVKRFTFAHGNGSEIDFRSMRTNMGIRCKSGAVPAAVSLKNTF